MLSHTTADAASDSVSVPFPVHIVSERALVRDLVVDYLRRHGFAHAVGRATLIRTLRAQRHRGRGLVFVDLENQKEDPRQLLHELRAHPRIHTVAIGTPIQLAAQGQDADGWLEVSEPATALAASVGQVGRQAMRTRGSPAAERWARTWRTLTDRQRQVLALLGCGLDNQKLASALGVSERAAKAHVSALLDKFKADSRTDLALIASHANLHAPGVRWRD